MTQSSVRGEGTRPDTVPHARGRRAGRRGREESGTGTAGHRGSGGNGGNGGRSGRRRAGGRRHRALRWSATTLAVLILGTAGAGYLYYQHLNGNIDKGERSSGDSKAHKTEPNAAGQTPMNILLLGSDSRASDANVALGGGKNHRDNPPLADVQMLIHLSADRKSASVVSIPGTPGSTSRPARTPTPGRSSRRPTPSSTPRWPAAAPAAPWPPGRTSPGSTSTTG